MTFNYEHENQSKKYTKNKFPNYDYQISNNLIFRKKVSEDIKRENNLLMKRYEHYKNSDFDEYEKNFLLENTENKINFVKYPTMIFNNDKSSEVCDNEKNIVQNTAIPDKNNDNKEVISQIELDEEINNNNNLNKIPFSQPLYSAENLNKDFIYKKPIIDINETTNFSKNPDFIIGNRTKSQRNTQFKQTEKEINLNDKIDKKISIKDIGINEEDLKIKEKFIILKEKIANIKINKKEEQKGSKDKTMNISNKKTYEENDNNFLFLKSQFNRSLSSKITYSKPISKINLIQNSKNINCTNNQNYLKIYIDKEKQILRKTSGSDCETISPNNKYSKNIYNKKNKDVNENVVSNKNKGLSKEFNKVLNNLKIDNILQKTKMIFNKQISLNNNCNSNRAKDGNPLYLNKINISSQIILPKKIENKDSKRNTDIGKASENSNKSKSENIENLKPSLSNRDYQNNINSKDNLIANSKNNPSSTIIINNNININTYIDKGDLIFPKEAESGENDKCIANKYNDKDKNFIINNYFDKLRKNSNDNDNIKMNFIRVSEENIPLTINKKNTEKKVDDIKTNWEKKDIYKYRKVPNSTNQYKIDYTDKNYKNLLLCSYESGSKISEYISDKNNYFKEYERRDDNIKKENVNKFESIEKVKFENKKNLNDDYNYNYNKNRNFRNNNEILNTRNENLSPYDLFANNKRYGKPYSYIRSIDFDNKTSKINYFYNNEKVEKTKINVNLFNKYDKMPSRIDDINY